MTLADLRALLGRHRFAFAAERDLQLGIEDVLTHAGVKYQREPALGPRDRPDFLVLAAAAAPHGIAIEVKVDGTLNAVTRQMMRYAKHDLVDAVLLVTSLRRHAHQPETLNGKPVGVLVVGGIA